MDKKLIVETTALVLLFIAFPVISVGANHMHDWLWLLGLLAAVLGGVLPVYTRFMDHSRDAITDIGPEFDDRVS